MFFYLVQLIQTKSTKLQKVSQNIKQEEKNWLWSWWYVSSVFKWVPGVLLPHSPKQWLSYYFFFFFWQLSNYFQHNPKMYTSICTMGYSFWKCWLYSFKWIYMAPTHPTGKYQFFSLFQEWRFCLNKGFIITQEMQKFQNIY